MVKENVKQIIRESLKSIDRPVRLVVVTGEPGCDICPDAVDLARAMKAAAPKIALEIYDYTMDRDKTEEYGVKRIPAFVVGAPDGRAVTFSGSLEGVSLILLLEAIASISESRSWFPGQIEATLKLLSHEVTVQVLLENDCTLCRPVAETALGLALTNKRVLTEIIVADDYPDLLAKNRVKILPYTLFGQRLHLEGHVTESTFLEMIFRAEGERGVSDKRCIICGSPSPEMICQACKTKIQAEAVDQKRRGEKLTETGTVVEHRKHG